MQMNTVVNAPDVWKLLYGSVNLKIIMRERKINSTDIEHEQQQQPQQQN